MKKVIISLSFSILIFLFGCSSYNMISYNANQNMRNINLGMSKNQVIDIMGKYYIVSSASKDNQENIKEILAYKSDVNEEYKLVFINDKLPSGTVSSPTVVNMFINRLLKPKTIRLIDT